MISTWFTVGASVLADRTYGNLLMPEIRNYVYPPFSRVVHNTSEFNSTIDINNLGFRGPNTTIEKTKKRVLIVGDSFTFGWGVELDQTWVAHLQARYPQFEFLNLGQGGTHQGDHIGVLKKSIDELQPDIVMACVLQGNDLHQLYRIIEARNNGLYSLMAKIESDSHWISATKRLSETVYPNFTTRFGNRAKIQNRWLEESREIKSRFSDLELTEYEKLDTTLRNSFEDGLMNPSLILESLRYPKLYQLVADTSNVITKKAIVFMHYLFVQMDELCTQNGSKLIVVAQPCRPYGFNESIEPLCKMGFEAEGCDTLNALLPIEIAIQETGISMVSPQIPDDYNKFYFKYDGHWNVSGNRIFAKELINKLDSLPQWKHFLTS